MRTSCHKSYLILTLVHIGIIALLGDMSYLDYDALCGLIKQGGENPCWGIITRISRPPGIHPWQALREPYSRGEVGSILEHDGCIPILVGKLTLCKSVFLFKYFLVKCLDKTAFLILEPSLLIGGYNPIFATEPVLLIVQQ